MISGVLLLSLFTGSIGAQIDKGSLILSADAGLDFSFDQGRSESDGNGFAEAYFMTGSRLGLGGIIGEALYTHDGHYDGLVLAPGLRYYLGRPKASGAFFLQGNAGVLISTLSYNAFSDYYAKLGLGWNRQLSEGVLLEGMLGYRSFFGESNLPDQSIALEARLQGQAPAGDDQEGFSITSRKGRLLLGETGIRIGGSSRIGQTAMNINLRTMMGTFFLTGL